MRPAIPKRILIVGLGFLGSAIASEAARRDIETRVLTRSRPALTGPWELVVGDAAECGLVLGHGDDIDHIIYAAGSSVPAQAEPDPVSDLAQSLPPLLNVIDACAHVGCGLTLLSSGGTVYGNVTVLPISEHHPTNPVSAYGIRHLVMEKYALMQAERLGFNVGILRISNAYGDRQPLRRSQGIITRLLHSLAQDEPITVYGDGRAIRDYVHVRDVASAALQLLSGPPRPRIVNVGTGRGHSTLDLISVCSSVTGRPVKVRFEQSRIFDVGKNVLDISLLRQLIGFKPTALEFGVRQIWNRVTAETVELSRP